MKKIFLTILLLALALPQALLAQVSEIEIVSRNNEGDLGDAGVENFSISGDARYVAFVSSATNLVPGDTNGVADIFVYDRNTDTIERVSVDSLGAEADNASQGYLGISDDGRYTAFSSSATNLVAGDTNDATDVFVYDRNTDAIERVSVDSLGAEADTDSSGVYISDDGRYVSFVSDATNLVAGDTNDATDVFVYDRNTDAIERVSVDSLGAEANDSSDDQSLSVTGRYVIFSSNATNLVAGDTNAASDTFLYDRNTDTSERVSVSSAESEATGGDSVQGSISSDGRYVTFQSGATNIVADDTNDVSDIFLRDRTLGTTIRISESLGGEEGDAASTDPEISEDGRFVIFNSEATNLVAGDTNASNDVFVYDTVTENIERLNVNIDDEEANSGASFQSLVVDAGRYIAYVSAADNLVEGDDNLTEDLFVGSVSDDDGISDAVEDGAPGSGDADESGYADAIEHNVTSMDNVLTGDYTTVISEGDCFNNADAQILQENELDTNDSEYAYPTGIIDIGIGCKTVSDSGNITMYFYGDIDPTGMVVRKFDDSTNVFSNIDGATITEDTVNSEPVLVVEYTVEDGGELDEDGIVNGVVIDPVGLAVLSADPVASSGGSSSGSRPKKSLAQANAPEPIDLCHVFTTNMKIGSKFGEVSKLQELLNKQGFNSGVVDGIFGNITSGAVKAFQTKHGLVTDGIVGPITRGELNKCN